MSTREYRFYMKNWYKLEKFRPSGPRGPDAPTIQPKSTELPPYLPTLAVPRTKIYTPSQKSSTMVPRYFYARPHNLLVAVPVLIPLFRVPDMARCISHQYSYPIGLIHNIISIGTKFRSLFRPLKLPWSYRRVLYSTRVPLSSRFSIAV